MSHYQDRFLQDVRAEREVQDQKWGGEQHDRHHQPEDWALLLTKHVGKLADAAMEGEDARYLHQLIRVAALCTAAWEVYADKP